MALSITNNVELAAILTWQVGRWGGAPGATLRLFKNDFTPTPASLVGAFLEADFAGYLPIVLTGQLTAPAMTEVGAWESVSDLYTFATPATPPGNTIFGAFVLFAAQVVACTRFDTPINMSPGQPPFRIRLHVLAKSESLFQIES